MDILKNIVYSIDENDLEEKIKRLVTGVYMIGVETEKSIGCAYTLRNLKNIPHMEPEIDDAGKISGQKVKDVIKLYDSKSPLERGIAVATTNSFLNRKTDKFISGDPLLFAKENFTGKKVAMVGHFPFSEEIRSWAGEFTILELNPSLGDKYFNKEKQILKSVDLAIITGVTLLNFTFKEVIKYARDSFVMMIGPTVPFSDVLFQNGVNMVSSVVSKNNDELYKSISEGAIVPRFLGSEIMTYTKDKNISLPKGDFRLRIGRKK